MPTASSANTRVMAISQRLRKPSANSFRAIEITGFMAPFPVNVACNAGTDLPASVRGFRYPGWIPHPADHAAMQACDHCTRQLRPRRHRGCEQPDLQPATAPPGVHHAPDLARATSTANLLRHVARRGFRLPPDDRW